MNQIAPEIGAVSMGSGLSRHEQVIHVADPAAGLRAVIAIHSTALGPALGGCRMQVYPDEATGLREALEMSRSMTRKAALAGVALGGGACVVYGDPRRGKSLSLLLALGRALDQLRGRFRMVKDLGTTQQDMDVLRTVTPHARGTAEGAGLQDAAMAFGIFSAIEAAVSYQLARPSLAGLSVAVEGLDGAGEILCRYLSNAGARLVVTDPGEDRVRRAMRNFGASCAAPEVIHSLPVDVLVPGTLGCGVGEGALAGIEARIVVGAVGNRLAQFRPGRALMHRGILHVPDAVANAGGLIAASLDGCHLSHDLAIRACGSIHDTTLRVLREARRLGIAPCEMADRMTEALVGPRKIRARPVRSGAAF